MSNLIYAITAVIAFLSGAYKLSQARREHNVGQQFLAACIFGVGLATVLLSPLVLTAVSRIEPFPNFGRLLGHGVAVVAAFCMQGTLSYVLRPDAAAARRRIRQQLVVLVVVLLVMTGLFLLGDTRFTVQFVDAYGARPPIAAYTFLFTGYTGWSMIAIIRLVRFYHPHVAQGTLRIGLRAFGAGAVVGLGWVAWKCVIIVLKLSTGRPMPIEGPVAALLSAIMVMMMAVGTTLTLWAPALAAPVRWWRARRIDRRLDPLWTAVCTALPEIVLPQGDAPRGPLRRLEFATYRKVIEIRDAHLALRQHFDPAVPLRAAELAAADGLDERRTAVVVEAAVFAAAIAAKRDGRSYEAGAASTSPPADIAAETRWLGEVSRAFVSSPIVRAVAP
ncbi:hypothetical protein D5S17_10140 [Pseudonocardiaceae bacterium YIM PH 21723]|nr:hypothetical protein D5S17_10140 [Pseudonocardiaceae bacterium YIM PH 21723]